MTTPLRKMLALSMFGTLLVASGMGEPEPPRRRSDPPPPPPPKAKTPEEAAAELDRHRRWCVEMDAAAERRRVEAERVERGRKLERFHGLPKHEPPLTEEEIAEVARTGRSPRPAPPPTREQARRLRQIERAKVKTGKLAVVDVIVSGATEHVAFTTGMTEAEALAIVRAGSPPDIRRASGDAVCDDCGKTFLRHPLDPNEVGFDGPFLNRLCSGELVKL